MTGTRPQAMPIDLTHHRHQLADPPPIPLFPMRLEDLNPAQRRAAETISGPVLILAGAGTGKTRVITTRICHLLRTGVRPDAILAVTFTNKAANEMRERVSGMVAKDKVKKLTISTFHSLCVRILRRDIEKLGYKSNFTIYTQSEQSGLMKRIVVKCAARGEKLDADTAIALISRQRNRGVPADPNPQALIHDVAREYRRQMKLLNAVDFDDLLILAEKLLRDFPDVASAWQARFDHIMVDEFQDTNRLQMELLRSLTGPQRNICVVGDDDQSIYGFRGAEISNILDFERFFSNPTVVTLEENYRSTNPILNTANGVIRNNRDRRPKRLWSGREGAEPVRVIAMPGDKEEAEFIVDEIDLLKGREQLSFDDFAILFRTNSQIRPFEECMRRRKIPYRIIGGRSFFDRREIKDALAWLHLMVNRSDDINLLRVINTPPRGIGETVIESATETSAARREPISHTLVSDAFLTSLSNRARTAVENFSAFLTEWQDRLTGQYPDMSAYLKALLDSIEYIPWLKRQCKDPDEEAQREKAIFELLESIKERHVRTETELIDFLASVGLDDDRESGDELEKQKGVSLITVHASKGLEFPVVYIPGFEEGIFPHKRSAEEGTKDEERRLLYVAITRAMRRLTLTYCASRLKWGERMPCQPSTFLRELDRNWVQPHTWQEIRRAPVSAADASSGLSALRARLLKGGN
jgi:superfamily I DNA/RNA helicase